MKILVKILVGSHMFGTNTENSDKDYRSIFIPDISDVILTTNIQKLDTKRVSSGDNNKKNSVGDVDHEMWSLRKFMRLLASGDTNAIEMLFAPESSILEKTEIWDYIVKHRHELIHSNATAFVGYCKTQADKYGVKGSRIAALEKIEKHLEPANGQDKLREVWQDIKADQIEYVCWGKDLVNNHQDEIEYMEVSSKKYQGTMKVEEARLRIRKALDSYGLRAKQARENKGIDWKALSHAMRVCIQAIELLNYGHITLPFIDGKLEMIMDIKLGKDDFSSVQYCLEKALSTVKNCEEKSKLPKEINIKKWCEDFVVNAYLGKI